MITSGVFRKMFEVVRAYLGVQLHRVRHPVAFSQARPPKCAYGESVTDLHNSTCFLDIQELCRMMPSSCFSTLHTA